MLQIENGQAPETYRALADDVFALRESVELLTLRIAEEKDPQEINRLQNEYLSAQGELRAKSLAMAKKADAVAYVIRSLKAIETECRQEESRLYRRRKAAMAAVEQVQQYVVDVALETGANSVKTTLNTLTVCRNGGAQSVEITSESLVPDELCRWTGSISNDFRQWLMGIASMDCTASLRGRIEQHIGKLRREVDMQLVREELVKVCETCDGEGTVFIDPVPANQEHERPCSICGGQGTQNVPGARLLPRGHHVRLS
jgi:hypothetical protein